MVVKCSYTHRSYGHINVYYCSVYNFSNRVEHHHYDGTRRVQTVVVSGLMSGGGAMASGDPAMQSMAMASEPSGESTEPENTNMAFTSSQMGASGQTFVVYREYVWGPGDHGVDEALVYYDATDEAWWCLTDLTGDLIALCDLGGTNGAARVVAQWTYDAYGSVMSADHLHSFERPVIGHKGLFLDRLDLVNPLGPQLVPFAQSVYHNRNRAYIPQMGRFLQQDPNQSAMSLIAASPFHGRGAGAIAVAFSLDGLYGDGANLYQYLGSNPWMRNDPTGLSWDPFSIVDEYLAEDAASKAAFLEKLVGEFNTVGHVLGQIAQLHPSVGFAVSAVQLANCQVNLATVLGILPGTKLSVNVGKLFGSYYTGKRLMKGLRTFGPFADDALKLLHLVPKFMGGWKKGAVTVLPHFLHKQYLKILDEILKLKKIPASNPTKQRWADWFAANPSGRDKFAEALFESTRRFRKASGIDMTGDLVKEMARQGLIR